MQLVIVPSNEEAHCKRFPFFYAGKYKEFIKRNPAETKKQ